MIGESYARKCARRIKLVMVDHFADTTLVDFDAILVPARRSGQLTRQQFDDVRVADIIAGGTPGAVDDVSLAVIESSISFNRQDARNALRRANMIQELAGRTTAAFCVAHCRWSDDLADIAASLGGNADSLRIAPIWHSVGRCLNRACCRRDKPLPRANRQCVTGKCANTMNKISINARPD